ncbi:MAG: PHP-associated domain-containing protein [Dehalococcoidia bacterium]
MFLLDMHCHSVASDDARATVEQYLRWVQVLRQRGYWVDGIVLTEHRKFDPSVDYTPLAQRYGVRVLKGAEVDTRWGHFLVYGVTEALLQAVDFTDVGMDARRLMEEAQRRGAIAIPAHPGRYGIGLVEFLAQGAELPNLEIIEVLNGGSRRGENERAEALLRERNLKGIAGSDAHFVSTIATCLTAFPAPISTEGELVEALRAGEFRPLRLEETAPTPVHNASK